MLTMWAMHFVWDVCISGTSLSESESKHFGHQNRLLWATVAKKLGKSLNDGKDVVLVAAAVSDRGTYTTINQ